MDLDQNQNVADPQHCLFLFDIHLPGMGLQCSIGTDF
jgi:hypothetical protein